MVEQLTNKKLKLFHRQAGKIRKYPDFFKSSKISINITIDRKSKIESKGVDNKTLEAVFLAFRPFVMKKAIPFKDICRQIITEHSTQNKLRKKTEEALDTWDKIFESTLLILKSNNKKITTRNNFQYWMNEEYFHPENYKIHEKRGLSLVKQHPILSKLSRFNLIFTLQGLCGLVLWVDREIISVLLNKDKE